MKRKSAVTVVWHKMGNRGPIFEGHPGEESGQSSASLSGAQAQPEPPQSDGEKAVTVKLAVAVPQQVFHHRPEDSQKPAAAGAVPYPYGTFLGGLYGPAAERFSELRWGGGTLFGAALWLLSDELAVPLLKLSKGLTEYSAETHLYALASHRVYGAAAEALPRGQRATIVA